MTEEKPYLHLDLRSLALMRIGLGLVILLDLSLRARNLVVFYTDQGVLSRRDLLTSDLPDLWFSLYFGGGGWPTAAVLFLLTAACAWQLIRGWQTRWMVAALWLLVNSLCERNPLVADRGDLELILVLFWGFFLPLDGRWSQSPAPPEQSNVVRNVATVAFTLQLAQVYFFAGLLKHGQAWSENGQGLWLSLRSALFATGLGQALSAYPELLHPLNYVLVFGEIMVGFLLLSPAFIEETRNLTVAALVVFHLLIGLLFHLGIFPIIALIAVLGLLPPSFWQSRSGVFLSSHLERRFGPASPRSLPSLGWAQKVFLAVCVAYTLVCNLLMFPELDSRRIPEPLKTFGSLLRLEQHWDLFGPLPPYDGWFVLEAVPEGIDLLRDRPVTYDRQHNLFPDHRWRMFSITLLFPVGEPFVANYVHYQVERYRRAHPHQIVREVTLRFEFRQPDGSLQSRTLWRGSVEPSDRSRAPDREE
ncbi:MAG: HTTM domain-containing protein [Vulcanimicrobiota bacterium]